MPHRGEIELDGGSGEGGGQVLRTALALSAITGRPFAIRRTRANRPKPGLRPQHRAAVLATGALCGARVEGADLGSLETRFAPARPVAPGEWDLDIGTAGSTSLLLQTLCHPLALAGGPSRLTLRGGTHVENAPTFHYLALVWAPAAARLGFSVDLSLQAAGFHPEGGGEIAATVNPARPLPALDLPHRGVLREVEVISIAAGLDREVAERQGSHAVRRLREHGVVAEATCIPVPSRHSRGCHVLAVSSFERTRAGHGALAREISDAGHAGDAAAEGLLSFLEGRSAVDAHLGDQLLLPAAIVAAGLVPGPPGVDPSTRYTVARVTRHLTTNAGVIQRFLPSVRIEIAGSEGGEGDVRVRPANLR